ncbi:MAG: hypothetical protein WC551_07780 [Patescibacteria group bacterium]
MNEIAIEIQDDGQDEITEEACVLYRIEIRSKTGWAGTAPTGGWMPAIAGTLNQGTGMTDEELSTLSSRVIAQAVVDDVIRPQMRDGDEIRIREI